MSMEIIAVIVSIFGFFITLALGVNAFFLRGIFLDLNAVKISMATMFERGNAKEKRIEKIEINEREIFERINKLERGESCPTQQ